ncbi:MAG TPA: enoyl-CoA hydratase/isomerase family protein [Caulobacteraceae bacterium]|nr:enoyl-CoA hydratase/isomerase family protein [Caulobacteraceae bacterium]
MSELSSPGAIHVERLEGGVALLTIDNPPMNALGVEMRERFMATLDEVEADEGPRSLIITGAGRAFCSGDDLKAVGGEGEDLAGFARLLNRLDRSNAATIAAVNGWCVGGGFELALCCDIRIASVGARFIAAGVNVGLMASAYRLPRLIGLGPAKAMLLTGAAHDAATAERWGLVTAVHEPGELRDYAIALAHRIASRAPLSVAATKRVAARALDLSPKQAAELQAEELKVLRASADHKEAVAAFKEKRDPVFRGS